MTLQRGWYSTGWVAFGAALSEQSGGAVGDAGGERERLRGLAGGLAGGGQWA